MAEGPNNGDLNIRINRFNRLGAFFSSIPLVELIEVPPAMTQAQLQEIPKVTITKEQARSAIKCAVCLDEFQLNENQVCKLPTCNHMYHDKCVFPWLEINPSCPVCRAPLPDVTDNNDHLEIIFRQHFDRLTADLFRHIAESQDQLPLAHARFWRITPVGLLQGERRTRERESSSARTRRHETVVTDSFPVRRLPRRAALRAVRAIHNFYRPRTGPHQ